MTAIAYCSENDIISVLSSVGVTFATDDNRSGSLSGAEVTAIDDCISQAQSKINYFLVRWYQLSSIPGNTWIRWCTAIMSACQLMRRRGEVPPDGLKLQEDQYLQWLEEIQNGRGLLPPDGENDAKLIVSGSGMTMSNLTIDQRFRTAKIRYVPRLSTGPAGPNVPAIPRFPDYSSTMFTQ